MLRLILLSCLSMLVICADAQSKEDIQLEKKLDELLSVKFKANEPGCAILVARKGNIIYKKAFGAADIELNVPLKPEMIFKLGSITKQFTAVAILQLMEQGKLSLQDSIQQFIKDFPVKNYTITIEHLLTHTSGIKDYLQIEHPNPYAERSDYSPQEVIDLFKSLPLEFEPGTKYSYSNSGYFLLGYIIEKLSGKTYQQYIQQNLLDPLSLQHTYFGNYSNIVPGRVKGYRQQDGVNKNADFWSMTVAFSAGEMMSSVEDLFRWHTGLYTYKILKKETLEKAFTPYRLKNGSTTEYGYGWIIADIAGSKSIAHGGTVTGFLTNEMYYPSQDVFITLLFNSMAAPRDELSMQVSSYVLNKPVQPDIKMDESVLNSYVGIYSLTTDPKRTIEIVRTGDHLGAKIAGGQSFLLGFETNTKFQFINLVGATGEFMLENGKPTGFNITQNGQFFWKRIN